MADYISNGVESIENVAQEVIKKHHEKLANVKIGYRFRDKAKVSKGRMVYGEIKKVPKLWQTFIEEDIILIVPETYWSAADNIKREAMIDEAFLQIDLEPIQVDNFPKRIGKELYELSNGERVEGIREAKRAQDELCDYKISILDYAEEVIAKNIARYGCWKEGFKKLKQTITQTRIEFDKAAGQ
ncbi:putative metallopeptidase [Natroniella sp. ANB-PHB2]|uniref:putative metallopeptidase n=1 Tax=Natroniella sp. ANB-PHB2 TaxID=3384444 RepID=UPI0038D467B6